MKQGVIFLMMIALALVLTGVISSCIGQRPEAIYVGTGDLEWMVFTEMDSSITNPDNDEFLVNVAFDLDKDTTDVTQEEFNERYN